MNPPRLPHRMQERVAYESLELPLYIRRAVFSAYCPCLSHPCHWHGDLEFLYTERGHISYHVDGKTYFLEEGDGIFVNANHLHYGFSADGTDCTFVTILFHPAMLSASRQLEREFLQALTENKSFPACVLRQGDCVWGRCLSLVKEAGNCYLEKRFCYELELVGLFFRIAAELVRNMDREEPNQAEDWELSSFRAMSDFVSANHSQKLRLEEIAACAHICESQCCRIFRKYASRSPIVYLNQVRLEHSRALLADSALPVSEVSHIVGFGSPSYYISRFRELYGVTPLEYRNRMRCENN